MEFTFTTTAAVPHMPVSKDMGPNPTQSGVLCVGETMSIQPSQKKNIMVWQIKHVAAGLHKIF